MHGGRFYHTVRLHPPSTSGSTARSDCRQVLLPGVRLRLPLPEPTDGPHAPQTRRRQCRLRGRAAPRGQHHCKQTRGGGVKVGGARGELHLYVLIRVCCLCAVSTPPSSAGSTTPYFCVLYHIYHIYLFSGEFCYRGHLLTKCYVRKQLLNIRILLVSNSSKLGLPFFTMLYVLQHYLTKQPSAKKISRQYLLSLSSMSI